MTHQLEVPVLVSQMVELRDPWLILGPDLPLVSWPTISIRAEFELNGSKYRCSPRNTPVGPSSSYPVATLDLGRRGAGKTLI